MSLEETEYLFAYGTLQNVAVQLATFGRKLNGQPDALVGYRLVLVEIADQDFAASHGAQQRSLESTGLASDFVAGMVFAVTRQELVQSDEYEPADYHRVRVALRSGGQAWVYVQIGQSRPR